MHVGVGCYSRSFFEQVCNFAFLYNTRISDHISLVCAVGIFRDDIGQECLRQNKCRPLLLRYFQKHFYTNKEGTCTFFLIPSTFEATNRHLVVVYVWLICFPSSSLELPHTPTILAKVLSTSIVASWSKPDPGNDTIRKYFVRYWEVKKGKSLHKMFESTATSAIVSNLSPFTDYMLEVSAVSDLAEGMPMAYGFKTLEAGKTA